MFGGFSLSILLGRVLGLVIGFTLHEFAHAWTADRLGDYTPRFQRRLTLDPRSHIEPIGVIMALVAGIGWAKPVLVNPHAFYPNERRGMMIVAMAGPVMNLLIAVVFGLLARLILAVTSIDSGFADFLMEVLLWFIVFQLMLFFFNLIPLAPLDGWKVMLGLVPPHTAADLQRHEQEAMFALMMLIFIGFFIPGLSLIGAIISPPIRFVFGVLTGL